METTKPIPIVYVEPDEIIHTPEHPFCGMLDCPCHQDETLIAELMQRVTAAGGSYADAMSIFWNLNPDQEKGNLL